MWFLGKIYGEFISVLVMIIIMINLNPEHSKRSK